MTERKNRVCPVERAGSLDNRLRKWVQNPPNILSPFVREGMTVLDLGCGPGYFTIDLARLVGESGRVIAVDLQEGMLRKLRDKIAGTDLEGRITLHQCEPDKIGWSGQVDFALAFYVMHEIQDQRGLFRELASLLSDAGRALVVEPPFHVSKADFLKTIGKAQEVGFTSSEGPKVLFSKSVLLKKG